ncbi:MBL fold metallo-hydrolase [Flavobacterium columnare]|uniref:MBL fold metallo-hydrolase n=1 Tax=Flavobacterium columnare TaxID=996 RepID=UPI000BEA6B83|nr:MBL fold metallo-hydrolase [Flavobacterium columnare]PDS21976.1 MBL fold metallo-hydrolase [Flavobacterium columnare] [Flavobacterium columnare NBRC 100251 = ATCC 23463]QOG90757.1 MBL fold metallo-hydrolase [Flavobacterium columnare]QOG93411.1 MBL fold metallo-hydrolase [Flavobacterium columnare]QOG96078.1 MBL fold metallo-hydrolase [Flavobacterium columnare]QOG98738.1 MBL fold metallo-hydrolase [Flavobacterium columnare]
MKIEQIYTGCLAEACYYIVSDGEAVIVDPLRDIEPYLDCLKKEGVTLKYIFETHFHADFVSGHIELARATGATIVIGPTTTKTGYPCHIAFDNEIFQLGKSSIKLIHTPGHTLESSCLLLIDENQLEKGIITGDTLFIGDVGRPDLAQHVMTELSEDKLARLLYHSLRNKILPLPDHLIVYPNHGAGSACGKNMSKETTDTLGNQKKVNYALNPNLTEDDFVQAVLEGLMPPPPYFPKNVLLNIKGYESLYSVINRSLKKLDITQFEKYIEDPTILLLDVRNSDEFAKGFIPNSINIGLNGNFAQWVGELIPNIEQKILLITEDEEQPLESIIRLSRIGFDQTIGYLKGGFKTWKNCNKPFHTIQRMKAMELTKILNENSYIIDVRKINEYNSQHITNSINIPLHLLENNLNKIPLKTTFFIHCLGGYRSMMAASILYKKAITNFIEIEDGFNGIKKTEIRLSDYQTQTCML